MYQALHIGDNVYNSLFQSHESFLFPPLLGQLVGKLNTYQLCIVKIISIVVRTRHISYLLKLRQNNTSILCLVLSLPVSPTSNCSKSSVSSSLLLCYCCQLFISQKFACSTSPHQNLPQIFSTLCFICTECLPVMVASVSIPDIVHNASSALRASCDGCICIYPRHSQHNASSALNACL